MDHFLHLNVKMCHLGVKHSLYDGVCFCMPFSHLAGKKPSLEDGVYFSGTRVGSGRVGKALYLPMLKNFD